MNRMALVIMMALVGLSGCFSVHHGPGEPVSLGGTGTSRGAARMLDADARHEVAAEAMSVCQDAVARGLPATCQVVGGAVIANVGGYGVMVGGYGVGYYPYANPGWSAAPLATWYYDGQWQDEVRRLDREVRAERAARLGLEDYIIKNE